MNTDKPRICVVGAGAIGGYFAARLAQAGNDVSVLARGATLAALQQYGVRLESGGEHIQAPVRARGSAEELGRQDIVLIAVKAPAMAAVAHGIAPLIGPGTIVLPALNGIPWWFFLDSRHPLAGLRLRTVDADGSIEANVPLATVAGIVVFASSSSPEPGVVHHASGKRIVLGEPGGGVSDRTSSLATLFGQAGFDASASADVRADVWVKLLGNACFNPVSMLTGRETDTMIDDPRLNAVFVRMMDEMLALGDKLGLLVRIDPHQRIAGTRQLGHIKTSMLQDLEASRAVEIDSILGALVECAAAAKAPVPTLETVYALARMRAQALGLY
jgi:2-dehydropantoate 2-reductase